MEPQTNPIPPGFHTLTPFLVVKDVVESIDFCRRAFNAREIYHMEVGNMEHAELEIGDSRIMLSRENADHGWLTPSTIHGNTCGLYIYVTDVDAAFDQAVNAGGKAMMTPADMFWGDRMGELIDPSGHRWSLATHKVDLKPEEIRQRAEEYFASIAKG